MLRLSVLVFIAIATIAWGKDDKVLNVACDATPATKCDVQLMYDGEMHAFSFERASSIFADDLTVGSANGLRRRLSSDSISEDTLVRFHVFDRKESKFATAAFLFDEKGQATLRHAVFFTKNGHMVEFESHTGNFINKGSNSKSKRRLQGYMSNWSGALATDPMPFFDIDSPGSCYPGDNVPHIAPISIVADVGVIDRFTQLAQLLGTPNDLNAILRGVADVASLAQLIWLGQLNVRIVISHIELGDANSISPLNYSPSRGTCGDASAAFGEIRGPWMDTRPSDVNWGGVTMLISQCYDSAAAGISNTGSYCWPSKIATAVAAAEIKTFAHELGHTFGASHTFQNGVGTTGGIMDYGSGFYNNVLQFHDANKVELCSFLTFLTTKSNCDFEPIPDITLKNCGDKILGPGEECECADGSTACDQCVKCKLTAPVTCSTTFAIRQASDVGLIAVSSKSLSSPECCNHGQVAVARLCNDGQDMCSFGGFCTSICRALGFPPCGVQPAGCRQKCLVQGVCLDTSTRLTAKNFVLNAVRDGTSCIDAGLAKLGTCSSGTCYVDGKVVGTPPPTRVPTLATKAPVTASPTEAPSRQITKTPTIPKSKAPSTISPSKAASRPLATAYPTSVTKAPVSERDAEAALEQLCAAKKTRRRCKKPCHWCKGAKSCMATCPNARRRQMMTIESDELLTDIDSPLMARRSNQDAGVEF